MGMLGAIGWISAADHVVFRRDRGTREGWPLSLYLYFGKRGKRESSTLFSITELIYHFDLSDTVIVGSFSKKEEKRYRELDKRCPSFSDERWYLSRIIFKCKYFSQVGKLLSGPFAKWKSFQRNGKIVNFPSPSKEGGKEFRSLDLNSNFSSLFFFFPPIEFRLNRSPSPRRD